MDDAPSYSKWRKPNAEPKAQDLVRKEEFKAKYEENEEKRKQLMLENQRRRRQKENRLKEEEDRKRRAQQQLLNQRKKDKEQAYIKYLRSNVAAPAPRTPATTTARNNLYDKYEAKKREELEQVEEIKPAAKWNKSSGKKEQDNLMGLDLDIQAKDLNRIKRFYEQGKEQLNVIKAFEEEWEDSHELIKSSMLDSLDLDQEAVAKSKVVSRNQPAIFEKDYVDMKKSIALLEVEEQIQRPASPEKDIKDLIGYESGSNFWQVDPRKKQSQKSKTPNVVVKNSPDRSKEQAFKKNKEIKQPSKVEAVEDGETRTRQLLKEKPNLMGWAGQTVEEADELFSNCDSNNSKRRSNLLQQVNEKIAAKKKLGKITEQSAENSDSREQLKTKGRMAQPMDSRSNRSNSKDKAFKAVVRKTPERINSKSREKQVPSTSGLSNLPLKNSKQKYTEQRPALPKASANRSTGSMRKQQPAIVQQVPPKPVPPKKQSKTVQKFRSRLSQEYNKPTTTVCTQDDMLHIDEFIKDELRDLNAREHQLQNQIKKMHLQSRDKVKEVQQRYEVNTKLLSTKEVAPHTQPAFPKKNLSQSQLLEQSLYRIEEMLIRKEQNIKQLHQQMKAQEQRELLPSNVTVSDVMTPEFNQRGIKNHIDPMASSNELLQQVARLTAEVNENRNSNIGDTAANKTHTKVQNQQPKSGSYAQLRKLQKQLEQQPPSKWKRSESQEKDRPKQAPKEIKQQRIPVPSEPISEPFTYLMSQDDSPLPSSQPGEQRISVNNRLKNLLLE